jgi:hypothetical protein
MHDRPIRLGLGFSDAHRKIEEQTSGLKTRSLDEMAWQWAEPEGVARGAAIPLPYISKLRISSSLVRLPFTSRFAV